mgnify:CR=1 FL=1
MDFLCERCPHFLPSFTVAVKSNTNPTAETNTYPYFNAKSNPKSENANAGQNNVKSVNVLSGITVSKKSVNGRAFATTPITVVRTIAAHPKMFTATLSVFAKRGRFSEKSEMYSTASMDIVSSAVATKVAWVLRLLCDIGTITPSDIVVENSAYCIGMKSGVSAL